MNNLGKNDYTQIDLYIHNLMTDDEKNEFEKQLSLNPDLADEVELRRFILMHQAASLKTKLKALYEEVKQEVYEEAEAAQEFNAEETKVIAFEPEPRPFFLLIFNSRIAYYALAIITFVFSISMISSPSARDFVAGLWSSDSPGDTTRAPHYSPPVNPLAAVQKKVDSYIGESTLHRTDIPTSLASAVKQFEQKNFDKAQQLLQTAKADHPKTEQVPQSEDDLVFGASPDSSSTEKPKVVINNPKFESYRTFYNGLIHLSEGKTSQALVVLKKIKGPLQPEAQWYMTLAYLKRMDTTQAKPLLKLIRDNTNNPHAREANELLLTLK